jgi:DNA excision repair protein ERCC-2
MQYVVAVRALCEFTAKRGSLDLRFTPSPTSEEGIAGHKLVGARRGAAYETEISLTGTFKHLAVRGRADGFDAARGRLEEIKTHRGDLARQPDNHRHLHWAQLKIYGWLLCEARGLASLTLALVYLDIGNQRETVIEQTATAEELREFFEAQCGLFLDWADQELTHRERRDVALATLTFPHADFRAGQRDLAEAVYRAAAGARSLMAQAPTGIGKTIGTVFPLLKAAPGHQLDKIFFLAAKASGKQLALDVLQRLRDDAPGLPLRVLELTAREKACEHPDRACHGESCELARGFYDRLPAARAGALQVPALDRATLREVALRHGVCPYYLGQEMARWSDLVVGDYNYFFDASALLHALTAANDWRVGVLVDEAHNMIERARAMYTASLHHADLRAAKRAAPAAVAKKLDKVLRAWNAWLKPQEAMYQAYEDCPDPLLLAMQQACAAMADHFVESPAEASGALQQTYFDLLQFLRLAESFGMHSLFDATRLAPTRAAQRDTVLCIGNLIPASFLAPRFGAAHTVTLFSATLNPRQFYQDALGLPENTAWVDVASPFASEQLAVKVVRDISTRFADRQRSAEPIARLIAQQYARAPGNYLAFFSSYDYLQMVLDAFRQQSPDTPVWPQARQMREEERQQFLARFVAGGRGIGFSVLGGSFAEGIDLPGDRLVGAFIATLGLPQVNPVNEEMMQRMNDAFGPGYDYTYLYPGIRKVVQAAGRVIRTREDKGVVYLIDDRFDRAAVRKLLPAWWDVSSEVFGSGGNEKLETLESG